MNLIASTRTLFICVLALLASTSAFAGTRVKASLFLGQESLGLVWVNIETPSEVEVDTKELASRIQGRITPAIRTRIESLPPMASLDELTNAGISTSFDEETLKLQIDLASTELKTQEMKLLENYDDETGALIVNPSPWSGFANIRIQQSIDKSTNSSSWLRVPVSGAVDWVNDIYSVRAVNKFLFAENTSPVLNRNESYVFYDLEKQQSRIIAGDIIPTIRSFQNSRNLLGLSYRKERELQNWWQFQNTGRKEILLNEASEIEIYLNGTLRERFQAPAGPLSIDQIPLYSGSNELKIIVRSQSGAVREITEELFHDETVLKKGESDYSFNVGTASSLDGLSRRYQTDDWYGSAYYRFGLATSFDMGMNSQISDQSFAVGIEAKKALKIGLLGTELMTYFPKDTNTAAAIRFSWNSPKAISFYSLRPYTRSYIEVYSTGFSSPLQLGIPSQKQVSVFNSVSFEAPLRLQQSIDWRRDWLHGGAHESRWGYNVRRNIMKSWSVSAGYEYLDPNESKHNFTVGLTWRETRKNLQARSFFQSRNQQSRVELLHDPGQRVQNFSQKATLQKSTDATDARLDLNYKGNRGSAELNYDYSKFVSSGNYQQARIALKTTLAYTPSSLAFGQDINDSFLIARKSNDSSSETPLFLGHQSNYSAKIDFLGPGLATDVSSRNQRLYRVNPQLKPGQVPPKVSPEFILVKGKKFRGSEVSIDIQEIRSLKGRLVFKDLKPAAYVSGTWSTFQGDQLLETDNFFTNSDGRFFVESKGAADKMVLSRLNSPEGRRQDLEILIDSSSSEDLGERVLSRE